MTAKYHTKMTAKNKTTEHPNTGLAKARAKAVEVLGNDSPRKRGEFKTARALQWIYRFGWASSSTLEKLCGTTRSGLAARLEKNGLVTSIKTESGGGVKSVPASIFTLTSLGLEVHEATENNPIKYVIDPYKINQTRLRHDNIIQLLTVDLVSRVRCINYHSGHQLIQKSEAGVKQPDAVWRLNAPHRPPQDYSIEVELSQKWSRELDTFVRDTLLSVEPKNSKDKAPRFAGALIYCGSPAILKNYTKAFTPGTDLNLWKCDKDRHWKVDETIKIPQWADEKIGFFLIDLDKPTECDI